MTSPRIRIAGTGVVCALGGDAAQVMEAIKAGRSGLSPPMRFQVAHHPPLPVGEALDPAPASGISRTVQLARIAADQAMASGDRPPDAVVVGVTTGGMAVTEELLKQGCIAPEAYRNHGIGTVAEDLAARFRCRGPVLTVSTACSSGGCAIALAVALIRSGDYKTVLTGGADSLCRLTYYGFKSLQLIDPQGARPLDRDRCGMSVAEGAGMLLLEAADEHFRGIEILGAGLSCDAHHPAQPHPEGRGALEAMRSALSSAGLEANAIDYVNLHGTGTIDNDRSESIAVNILCNDSPPPASSIKGATGHSLAASGAIEAVIATLCLEQGLIPANTGCRTPDPGLEIKPVDRPVFTSIDSVMSNSFGFGGNNATVVVGRSRDGERKHITGPQDQTPLRAIAWSAVTGAGFTDETLHNLSQEHSCMGRIPASALCQGLPSGLIRRTKRLSQIALALLAKTQASNGDPKPTSIFLGTGWGSLSETHDFLKALFDSNEKFSSPTDFIGSVHNAAAGQMALMSKATGPNLTLSGGDFSFEQALLSAQMLVTGDDPVMVLGADETHEKLSLLFDPSITTHRRLSDGGGALLLRRTFEPVGPRVALRYFATCPDDPAGLHELIAQLGGADQICARYAMLLVGLPAAQKTPARMQLEQFLTTTGFRGPVLDYRRLTGEFATSAAVATVYAVSACSVETDTPFKGRRGAVDPPGAEAILVLGLGKVLTAVEVGAA